jgi:hypothetical protein
MLTLEDPGTLVDPGYLRDCAASGRKLALKWKPSRKRRSPVTA